jgi:hypothetical protein
MHQGPYSQQLMFFITCEWGQKAKVFHYTTLEILASDKHSSLLGPFASSKDNVMS